jgi:large subunit ribosomal protein L7/L12
MGFFGGGSSRHDVLRLEARVAALEATVARLTAAATPFDPASSGAEPWRDEARALKSRGRVIPAVKLVREQTGWGLKEAKDYVDGL